MNDQRMPTFYEVVEQLRKLGAEVKELKEKELKELKDSVDKAIALARKVEAKLAQYCCEFP